MDEHKIRKIIREELEKFMPKLTDAMRTGTNTDTEAQKNQYKETRKILDAYPGLKLSCILDEMDNAEGKLIAKRDKAKDIVKMPSNSCMSDSGIDQKIIDGEERLENKLMNIEKSKTEVKIIENALKMINQDKYYDIIELYFFGMVFYDDGNGKSWKLYTKWIEETPEKLCEVRKLTDEQIGEYYGVDRTVISKNRNRMINQLSTAFFGTGLVKN